jgi:acyl carrier protein
MPEDVAAYLSSRRACAGGAAAFHDRPLPDAQRTFVYRARRSAQRVLPATVTRPVAWDRVQEALAARRRRHAPLTFSDFEVLAYQLARAGAEQPQFRSVLLADDRVREYEHVNLGIAVQRPGDELVTAVVPQADALDFPTFVGRVQQQVAAALEGADQATDQVQLLLTYLAGSGVTAAVPLLVAPAVAILFVGTPSLQDRQPVANLTLTFDHRLINGLGAARFLQRLAGLAEQDDASAGEEPPEPSTALRPPGPADATAEWAARLDELVRGLAGRLLGVSADAVPRNTPLRLVGLDSLQSVALAQQLDAALDLGLTASLVWNYPTVQALVEHLVGRLSPAAGQGLGCQREQELVDQLRTLSEEEAAALVAEYGSDP